MNKHEEVEVSSLSNCDFCKKSTLVDGKTKQGPWANMCEDHFLIHGIGLGLGKGQKLVLKKGGTNVWKKEEERILYSY